MLLLGVTASASASEDLSIIEHYGYKSSFGANKTFVDIICYWWCQFIVHSYCKTQPPASIGWIALSSMFIVCHGFNLEQQKRCTASKVSPTPLTIRLFCDCCKTCFQYSTRVPWESLETSLLVSDSETSVATPVMWIMDGSLLWKTVVQWSCITTVDHVSCRDQVQKKKQPN